MENGMQHIFSTETSRVVKIALHGSRGQGKFAFVDEADYEYLNQWKWHVSPSGYAVRKAAKIEVNYAKNQCVPMHRVICCPPNELQVDHIDGNRLNNCRSNLRPANYSQNGRNKRKYLTSSSSQFKGVTWHKGARKWQAQVKVSKKVFYLGLFESETDAAKAYNDACIKIDPIFFRLNEL